MKMMEDGGSPSDGLSLRERYEDVIIQRDVADEAARKLRDDISRYHQKAILIEMCVVELGEIVKGIHEKCQNKLKPPFPFEKTKMVEQIKLNPLRMLRSIKNVLLQRDEQTLSAVFLQSPQGLPGQLAILSPKATLSPRPKSTSRNFSESSAFFSSSPVPGPRPKSTSHKISESNAFSPSPVPGDSAIDGFASQEVELPADDSMSASLRIKRVSDRFLQTQREKKKLFADLELKDKEIKKYQIDVRSLEDEVGAKENEIWELKKLVSEKDVQLGIQLDQLIRLPKFEEEVRKKMEQTEAASRKAQVHHRFEMNQVVHQLQDHGKAMCTIDKLQKEIESLKLQIKSLKQTNQEGQLKKLEQKEGRVQHSLQEARTKISQLKTELKRVNAVAEKRSKQCQRFKEEATRWQRTAQSYMKKKTQNALAEVDVSTIANQHPYLLDEYKGRLKDKMQDCAHMTNKVRTLQKKQRILSSTSSTLKAVNAQSAQKIVSLERQIQELQANNFSNIGDKPAEETKNMKTQSPQNEKMSSSPGNAHETSPQPVLPPSQRPRSAPPRRLRFQNPPTVQRSVSKPITRKGTHLVSRYIPGSMDTSQTSEKSKPEKLFQGALTFEYQDVELYIKQEMEATEHDISLATKLGEKKALARLGATGNRQRTQSQNLYGPKS